MKTIVITEDVELSGQPKFTKGQEVRVSDSIADILVERGHAKEEKGKMREEVKNEKAKREPKDKDDVKVSKHNS